MIYTVKRFSQTIEEKEYSIVSNYLDKLKKDVQKAGNELSYRKDSAEIFNPRLTGLKQEEEFIEKETKNTNSRIYKRLDSEVSNTPANKKDYERYKKWLKENNWTEDDAKIINMLMSDNKNGVSQIFWNREDGLERLAHELGHIKNAKGKNWKDKIIHSGAKLGLKLRNLNNGVFNALIEVLGSKMICWEESNASKKGYEMLKKYNLTEDELKISKENMDNALEMYKLQGEIAWKQKLINSGLKNL